MKRIPAPLLLLVILLLAFLLPLASAHAAGLIRRPAPPLVELDISDREDGRTLPQYRHDGQQWIPGEPGHRYAVRLRNRGAQRVLVVLSVDGVNAISGQTADPGQAGYVLGPWQTLEVGGWRKSMDAVAQFVFVDPADSYAARTGRPDNVGVVGIAVYQERFARPQADIANVAAPRAQEMQQQRAESERASADASSGYHGAPSPSLGTGHGQLESQPAYTTTFERGDRPVQLTQLRYDTRRALLARGIQIDPPYYHGYPPSWNDAPRAFPQGFVPDPR